MGKVKYENSDYFKGQGGSNGLPTQPKNQNTNPALSGVLAGALAGAMGGKGTSGTPNGNKNKGNNGGNGGSGAAAPGVQATASGSSSSYNPYDYDPITGQILARPANEIYTPGQSVLSAQEQMNAAQSGRPGAYTPSAAANAAQQAMMNAQQGQPGAYTPSAEVLAAQQALQALQDTKPQGYTSKYGPQMEALLEQIQNPGQFNYEFNGDNLFKMYADEYTQRGKQAAQNAMGQAAALTGGYGNSYAQQVANQAYDQNLTELYDRGLELRDRAYEEWLNEQRSRYDQYGLLNDADQTDYGRYRDTVGDWENERDWLGNRYDTERNIDYGQYRDTVGDWEANRDYYTNQYNNEYNRDYGQYRDTVGDWEANRDYYTDRYDTERNVDYNQYADRRDMAEKQYEYDANMQENIRQFDESLNWDKMSADQKYAAEYAMNILAMGEMPSDEMLKAAGLSAADAQKLKAKLTTGGGTGGKKTEDEYQDPTNQFYVDNDGNYYYYAKDKNGNSEKVEVPDYMVKNNDLVHNIYEEGGQRRRTNKNSSKK